MNEGSALPPVTAVRLATQLDALPLLLEGVLGHAIVARPPSGQWSALENLAHLARYHEVFDDRLTQLLSEDVPQFGRYAAEDDPAWPEWRQHSLDDVLGRLTAARSRLVSRVAGLSAAELARTGTHPVIGTLAVPLWIEFFLLHEAHHLLAVMKLARGTR